MTLVHFEAGNVLATDNPRIKRGRLLPYNELGNTNLGRFAVAPGQVAVPRDPAVVGLNDAHVREAGLGRCVGLEDVRESTTEPLGVYASFYFADTDEGNAALAEVEDPNGKRHALSAEFGPVVLRAGKIVNDTAKLWGAALLERGAFGSAGMVLAADVGELETPEDEDEPIQVPEDGNLTIDTSTLPATITATVPGAEGTETATYQPVAVETQQEGTTVMANAKAPSTTPTGRPATPGQQVEATAHEVSPQQVFAAMAKVLAGQDDGTARAFILENAPQGQQVFAALNDIKYTTAGGVGIGVNQIPAWLGKMYAGRVYKRRYASLFAHKPLTSMQVAGWDWGVKPEGADYAGNKQPVPSNTPTVVPFADQAARWAGAHDHDRAFVDFPNPEYWEAYYAAMIEGYEKWVDLLALTKSLSGADDIVADDPAGLSIGAGLSALIDGAVQVIENGGTPTFGIMSSALYKETLKTPQQQTLGYLDAALGFEAGHLESSGFILLGAPQIAVPAGHVVVGDGAAATLYELGETPIRVDALDMVKGGVDTGVFGYAALYANKSDLIVDVAPFVDPTP